MLNEEQILKNYSRFTGGCKMYLKNADKLLETYGEKIQIAPASTLKSLHCSYPGGLVEHILEVVKCASKINKALDNPVDQGTLMRTVLLAEIGKADLYVINEDSWSVNNQGKMYNFNENLVSLRVGERSVYYALTCGCELTEAETQAILNFEKEEDKSVKWHTEPIGKILKMATEIAIINEKNRETNE